MRVQHRMVRVPLDLLFDRHLDGTAKFVWIVCRLLGGPPLPRTGVVQAHAGLARHTILRALARLRAAGWLPAAPEHRAARWLPPAPEQLATGGGRPLATHALPVSGAPLAAGTPPVVSALPAAGAPRPVPPAPAAPATEPARRDPSPPAEPAAGHRDPGPAQVPVPGDLILDRHLGVQAKVIYATLQAMAGHPRVQGQCTVSQISQRTGASPNTVKRALRTLQAAGWLEVSQAGKFSPIHFVLRNPVAPQRDRAVARVARRLKAAPFRGEALMREYLNLIVDSDQYDDNASPGFLVNPFTGEEMQFDRYYPPHVAVEFNGPQHYGPTDHYPDEQQALKQQARDYIKRLICAARGIHLIVVHPEDLTLARIQEKVRGYLPLRDLAGHQAVVAYLERVSRTYRRQVREARAADPFPQGGQPTGSARHHRPAGPGSPSRSGRV